MRVEPGQELQHYRILDKIGEGGMGAVWRALDTKLGREIALKVLPESMASNPERLSRFQREAKVVAALSHPNIVTLFSVEESDGLHYLTMELVSGRPLGELLPKGGFQTQQLLGFALQLADALESAHRKGIVHRDLKPDNVMVVDGGERLKILDFGLAKLTQSAPLENSADDSTMMQTQAGHVLGTPHYMSPEQARGREVDHRADIFSFGVMLFEMATGERPFRGESMVELLSAVIKDPAPALTELRTGLPPQLGSILDRCLSKNPDGRYASARELSDDLKNLQRQWLSGAANASDLEQTVEIAAAQPASSTRSRAPMVAALAVLIATAVALVWWGLSKSGDPAAAPAAALEANAAKMLAVFPFSVRGSEELAYLEEGMVDLLSGRLDGIGDTHTVSPRAVFSQLKSADLDLSDPSAEQRLATLVGATRYVTGDLVELGEQVTLTAYLHVVGDPSERVKASVEGASAELFALIDDLVADLATRSFSDPAGRLERSAALSSHSLEATKIYLAGERLLRAGRYREAAEAYSEALAIDPEFGLAHYRKSLAADWIDAEDVRSSAEEALRYADSLPERDRALLKALLSRREGRNREAEQAYRTILHRYPDEVDALLQLGEVLFHDNPRVGRSLLESFDSFERALQIDPANANARIHLARLHALRGEHEALNEIAEKFAESSAESERLYEVEALQAFVLGDEAAQREVVEKVAGKPDPYQFYAAHGVTRFARSAEGALRILTAGGSEVALLSALRAGIMLEQGQFAAVDQLLRDVPENDSAGWELYRAFMLTSGIVPHDEARLGALLDRVRALEPKEILATAWLPPYEDMTPAFALLDRSYHVALILIQLGRVDEAREVVQSIEQSPPLVGLGELKQQLLAELQAEVRLQAGDEAGALERLRTINYEIPHAISVRSFADGSRSRFLRAELERKVGDLDVAENFYVGLDQSWSWWDTGFRAQVYWGLARVAETQGRTDDARIAYERLLELWKRPDESLIGQRDEALLALESLPN